MSRRVTKWKIPLSRIVETRDGVTLRTLDDARRFVVAQGGGHNAWEHAAGRLLAAADHVHAIEEATKAVESALFLDGLRLKL